MATSFCFRVGALILSVMMSAPVFAAEMYKCEGENGIPLYQNFPCPKGKEIRNMSNDEPTISVIPMKPEPSKLTPATPQTTTAPVPVAAPPAATPTPSDASVAPEQTQARPPLIDLTRTPVVNVPESGLPQTSPTDMDKPISPSALVPLVSGETAPTPVTPEVGAAGQARMAIKAGMSEAEVEAKLGPPPMTAGDSSAPEQPKRWFYLPVEGDKDMITTIYLQHGKVTQIERKPVKK
ncbi:MAG: DUF4124 domain-containing protein [Burkholderiales bacterium]|jgi:hypothetical protein|nr:DUF4124 domain-containing protein [Burkholderiales bacterium]